MKDPEKGQIVSATTLDGSIVKLRVWGVGDRVIYLCSDSQFEKLTRGRTAPPPIGFPKLDVIYAG